MPCAISSAPPVCSSAVAAAIEAPTSRKIWRSKARAACCRLRQPRDDHRKGAGDRRHHDRQEAGSGDHHDCGEDQQRQPRLAPLRHRFGRPFQHQQVVAVTQQPEGAVGTAEQYRVARLQPDVGERRARHAALALHAEHVNAVRVLDTGVADRSAGMPRGGRDHCLGKMVVGAQASRPFACCLPRAASALARHLGGAVGQDAREGAARARHHQPVALRERQVLERRIVDFVAAQDQPRRQFAEPGKHAGARFHAEKRMARPYAQFADELRAGDEIADTLRVSVLAEQPWHDDEHVEGTDTGQHQAGQGDLEKAHVIAVARGYAGDQKVGGRADERGEAAEDRQEGERHHRLRHC